MSIPVIDLFAGPGGLGEGFSRVKKLTFKTVVSIEKDVMAHETLRLRAAHRHLQQNPTTTRETWETWDQLIEKSPWDMLFRNLSSSKDSNILEACQCANAEALRLELGPERREEVSKEIRNRLEKISNDQRLPRNIVLIGGPPCQAYSVVGRSRNKGEKAYVANEDIRHFLYLEYLHVITEFQPAVFVMENVKGILSSKVDDERIFEKILRDLRRPGIPDGATGDLEYVLLPLVGPRGEEEIAKPHKFILRAEDFGIPQARHRVIILGVRKDVYLAAEAKVGTLVPSDPPSVSDVIGDLPQLRPQVSKRGGGMHWLDALNSPLCDYVVRVLKNDVEPQMREVGKLMEKLRTDLSERKSDPGAGKERIRIPERKRKPVKALADWYGDRKSEILPNHESRSHMPSDIVRYLFVSSFGKVTGESPRLADFPGMLLPEHKNVDRFNVAQSIFKDRFRVQLGGKFSMTITSHIAKDGHAFIHYKPKQCRSLTVREAARLQTFPDSYVFLGNRTAQYTQVGNAVPPLLANKVADIVADLLKAAGYK